MVEIKKIFNWLVDNREWLFSGIAVVVLSTFYKLFTKLVRRKVQNVENPRFMVFISKFINKNPTAIYDINDKNLDKNLRQLVEHLKVIGDVGEIKPSLHNSQEKIRDALNELPVWNEAKIYIQKNSIRLTEIGYKNTLKKCQWLSKEGLGLNTKEQKEAFRQSLSEHLDWIRDCLHYQDDERFESELAGLIKKGEAEAYHHAFLAISEEIHKDMNSRKKKDGLSPNAGKLLDSFIDHLINTEYPASLPVDAV